MPVAAFASVLPHPETGALLVTVDTPTLGRALASGVPTVQAWGYPHLLHIGDAARLAAEAEAEGVDNAAANDLRTTYRETRDATRTLAALGRDLAQKRRDSLAAKDYNRGLPARAAAAQAARKAAGDASTKSPDEGVPDLSTFAAAIAAQKEA